VPKHRRDVSFFATGPGRVSGQTGKIHPPADLRRVDSPGRFRPDDSLDLPSSALHHSGPADSAADIRPLIRTICFSTLTDTWERRKQIFGSKLGQWYEENIVGQ